jgi:DNA-binding CsgD family transcriptional regulator
MRKKVQLSARQIQVLQHVSNGLTYKQVSETMNISQETVKMHLKNIYRKLDVTNKIEALRKVKLL